MLHQYAVVPLLLEGYLSYRYIYIYITLVVCLACFVPGAGQTPSVLYTRYVEPNHVKAQHSGGTDGRVGRQIYREPMAAGYRVKSTRLGCDRKTVGTPRICVFVLLYHVCMYAALGCAAQAVKTNQMPCPAAQQAKQCSRFWLCLGDYK